jgi:hypothetical protein
MVEQIQISSRTADGFKVSLESLKFLFLIYRNILLRRDNIKEMPIFMPRHFGKWIYSSWLLFGNA